MYVCIYACLSECTANSYMSKYVVSVIKQNTAIFFKIPFVVKLRMSSTGNNLQNM